MKGSYDASQGQLVIWDQEVNLVNLEHKTHE